MKQLKRLDLKKSTTLNDAEMKEILGGGVEMIGPTCSPCGASCRTQQGNSGICTPKVIQGVPLCVCVPD